MARKSTKRVAKVNAGIADLSRPFDVQIVARARAIAHKYRIILEPNDEGDCAYLGSALEMPEVYADGDSANECVKNVREALTAAVAYLIESGKTPPTPAEEQVRDKQVNIRLTAAEQRRLREAAKARGFNDVSDYMRSTSLYAH